MILLIPSKNKYPMLVDPARRVSPAYGTLIEDGGLSLRGTFLVNPGGVLKAYEINDNSIGRNINELIRKLQAAKFVAGHGGGGLSDELETRSKDS
jgi:NADH-dependent peroxiredoxin subunit C